MHADLYTDGGARGNPGPAAIGAVLIQKDHPPKTVSRFIGSATNNQAEYRALIAGLEMASHADIKDLTCYLDSELIVRQLNGEYRVRDEGLKKLFAEARRFADRFSRISFRHVPRERNKDADRLVNEALDREK